MPQPTVDRGATPSSTGFPGPLAPAEMRTSNMSLLLRHLRRHGDRSRAQLAAETGLSKATISSLAADLTERGLVRDGRLVRGAVGRPGLPLTLDGAHVTGVGVEIAVDYLALTAVTLSGITVRETLTTVDAAHLGLDAVLDRAAELTRAMLRSLADADASCVGITVAPPGVIDYAQGMLRFAPNLGWRQVPLVAEFAARLGPLAPPVRLENDAKLAALAEFARFEGTDVVDVLYLTGETGVGAGIIADGRLMRGWSGFSGEVGHLPLDPAMTLCNCGRRGCWELIVGLDAFLRLVAPDPADPLRDPAAPLEGRLHAIRQRVDAHDEAAMLALETITQHLSTGLSVLVDVLNPRAIVLGGYYAHFGDVILPGLAELLAQRRMDAGSGVELSTTRLGMLATARGGALLALEDVFDNPSLVPSRP